MESERQDKYSSIKDYIKFAVVTTALSGLLAGMYYGFTNIGGRRLNDHEIAARYLSLSEGEYRAIGNGGALAAFNGRVSTERKKMLERIDHLFDYYYFCWAPAKTMKQYEEAIEKDRLR